MKRKDHIQRNVRSGHISREKGSAPVIGYVARMPGSAARSISTDQIEEEVSSFRKKRVRSRSRTWLASVILAVAAVMVVVVAFYLWLSPILERREKMSAVAERERQEFTPAKPVDETSTMLTEKEALTLIRRALAVSSPEEVNAHILTGSASPEEVLKFLKEMPERDGKIERYEWSGALNENGLETELTTVVFSGKERPVHRMAMLVKEGEGEWKLDFAAFARWGKPGLNELLSGAAEEAEVRFLIGPDQYYNGPFQDESKWQSFGLVSLDVDQLFSGYCRVNSPQQRALHMILSDAAGMARVTLKLRRVEGAGARQFEIARVLAQDWVMGPVPFDEAIEKNAAPSE